MSKQYFIKYIKGDQSVTPNMFGVCNHLGNYVHFIVKTFQLILLGLEHSIKIGFNRRT